MMSSRGAILAALAILFLASAPSLLAGRFMVTDVWFDTADSGEFNYRIIANARAEYIGVSDSNDLAAILQTTVATNKGQSSDGSVGANLNGPFQEGQTFECVGSCGAQLYIRKPNCPTGPGWPKINSYYGGTGKVAIYHQGSPEIDIRKAVAQQVPCNPRLIRKYGVWDDGKYPVPATYRSPHPDLMHCNYSRDRTTVTVTDPTSSYTTITDYWEIFCN